MKKKFFVSICFDDGWRNQYKYALPLLQEYNRVATFYIISERINNERFPDYMGLSELQKLEHFGHEIGSHTRDHPHLFEVPPHEVLSAIEAGRDELREFGFEPKTFAYPYGQCNAHITEQVSKAGFLAARTIVRKVNVEVTDPLLLGAFGIREDHKAEDVISWIKQGQEQGGWVILYTHQVDTPQVLKEQKWIYGTTPTVLQDILGFLKKERIEVETVESGMKRVAQRMLVLS